MIIPRTIGSRIALGFGILIIAIVLNSIFSFRAIERLRENQQNLTTTLETAVRGLNQLNHNLALTGNLYLAWLQSGRQPGLQGDLEEILQAGLPEQQEELLSMSGDWPEQERNSYLRLVPFIEDSLIQPLMIQTSFKGPLPQPDSIPALSNYEKILDGIEFVSKEVERQIQGFERSALRSNERIDAAYSRIRNGFLLTGIIIAFAALVTAILLYLVLTKPIKQYRDTITSMGKGVIPEGELREGPDEMGQIGTALNSMIRGLRDLSVFAEEIGKGNFKSEFTPQSDKDILGNSLIRLREDLHYAAIEEEKRKREDERRNWSNQGIARFSEILRELSGDRQALAENLIAELVKYLGARVGGLFLIEEGEKEAGDLVLIASYAYDRIKHLKKTIQPGEGLAGRCVQEGSTIFLTEIPDDYIKIKSGLGEDNPKSLLIAPIRLNEEIIGVIEIASLEVFRDFQIEFVERIGTSIASSMSAGHQPKSK